MTSDSCVDPSVVSNDGTGARLKTKVTTASARVGASASSGPATDRERMDRTHTDVRRPRAFFDSHPFIVTHPSIGIIASTSRVDSTRRAARGNDGARARSLALAFSSPRRLSSRGFRASRSSVPSRSPSVLVPVPRHHPCRPPTASSSPASPSRRVPGARVVVASRSPFRFVSRASTRCSHVRVMTHQ